MTNPNACYYFSKPKKSRFSSDESRRQNTWPPLLYSENDIYYKKCTHLGCYIWCNACEEEKKKSSVPKSFADRYVRNNRKMRIDMSRHEQKNVKFPTRSSNPWSNPSTNFCVPCIPTLKILYEPTISQWLVDGYYMGMCIHMNNAIWCNMCGRDAMESSVASEDTLDRHNGDVTVDPPSNPSECSLIPSLDVNSEEEKNSSKDSTSDVDETSNSDREDSLPRNQDVSLEFRDNEVDEVSMSEVHEGVQTDRKSIDLVVPLRRNASSIFNVHHLIMFLFKNMKWFLMFLLLLIHVFNIFL